MAVSSMSIKHNDAAVLVLQQGGRGGGGERVGMSPIMATATYPFTGSSRNTKAGESGTNKSRIVSLYTSKYETLTLTERLEDASMSPYKWDMVRI